MNKFSISCESGRCGGWKKNAIARKKANSIEEQSVEVGGEINTGWLGARILLKLGDMIDAKWIKKNLLKFDRESFFLRSL